MEKLDNNTRAQLQEYTKEIQNKHKNSTIMQGDAKVANSEILKHQRQQLEENKEEQKRGEGQEQRGNRKWL